ncbi:MAG TPA: alkaline phosphatase family protein [Terriglobales bacterium]
MTEQRVWSGMAVMLLAGAMPGCVGIVGSSNTTPPPGTGIKQINHIIVMAQENRGFDHYFGAMRQYWAANGIADQPFDGLPQFNPTPGAVPTNPGCDPAFPPPSACTTDSSSPAIPSFHMVSMCVENPSPFWNEDHVDWNLSNPVSTTATLDGFAWTAANDARNIQPPFTDTDGVRAMGHYDGTDLPYYYFMASKFATSDRWFSPLMSRTQPNRMYLLAATSAGHVYPLPPGASPLTNKTIFDLLQSAGVSWKIYVTDMVYANPPVQDASLGMFTAGTTYASNIVPVSQFMTDLQNGTLPSVSYIEPGYNSGLDEHPGEDDNAPGGSIQVGSQYVSTLVNALMQSSSWKDSAFILTFDEFGGFYDHVPPQVAVSPDGIPPSDLKPGDTCTITTGPTCDFTYTGYRVPLIVISPFTKKNYVSHTVADSTATLKFIETRFGLSSLTKRDAAQMDMTEFFDFTNIPWATPPANIPTQPTNGQCYLTHLP